MLRPTAVQEALATLIETPSVPADAALLVFSDSGTIYAKACSRQDDRVSDTSGISVDLKPKNESQRLQRLRQPGLLPLLGNPKRHESRNIASSSTPMAEKSASATTTSSSSVELQMGSDEKCKVLAAVACQAWTEETNRVKRLFTKAHGHASASTSESGLIRSFSTSTGGGGGGSGNGIGNGKAPSRLRRIEQNSVLQSGIDQHMERMASEQEIQEEMVAAPVAVPGTLLNVGATSQGVAPLLLEGELGALLVMPLHHQAASSTPSPPVLLRSSPPLLLVLFSGPQLPATTKVTRGESILSQQQWNDLHDSAHALAMHVCPELRKAFGRGEGVPGEREREAVGDGATVSDMESSVDLDGNTNVQDSLVGQGLGIGGVPVR